MNDHSQVMSWLEGLAQYNWREFYSNTEVMETAKAALELLKEQPEIVRCKDCKFLIEEDQFECGIKSDFPVDEEWFCADGVKKE